MKRLNRSQGPADYGIKIIEDRVAALNALRSLMRTDEFSTLCNLSVSHNFVDAWDKKNVKPSLDISPESKNIKFDFSFHRQTTLDAPEVVELLEKLAKMDPDDTNVRDELKYRYRQRLLKWEFEDGFSLTADVTSFLTEQACVRVKVGTEVVDKYEYRCAPVDEVPASALPAPNLALELEGKI